jgi:multicomponent Na+:H+ antiporter subunit G
MMAARDMATAVLLLVGCAFFVAGTAGVVRFPDTLTRLHAVTKADNLGLGFLAAGLLLQAASAADGVRILLVWVLALVASASASYLIAGTATGAADPPTGEADG